MLREQFVAHKKALPKASAKEDLLAPWSEEQWAP